MARAIPEWLPEEAKAILRADPHAWVCTACGLPAERRYSRKPGGCTQRGRCGARAVGIPLPTHPPVAPAADRERVWAALEPPSPDPHGEGR